MLRSHTTIALQPLMELKKKDYCNDVDLLLTKRGHVLTPDKLLEQDLNRDAWWLLGFPVDNVTIESTIKVLRNRSKEDGSIVWSTVNINWFVLSLKNEVFRQDLLRSDLITLDGRPLLWLARLVGYPMKEVVPGSTLTQELNELQDGTSLSIYLFGGDEGAGELATCQVDCSNGGLRPVGYMNPGFGTVEEMSSETIIEKINVTRPDILLVALGASKGLRWIEHNRERLNAKVVSHLGATINFLAGTLGRAPVAVRNLGLEWCWRIVHEPKLFRRYFVDGMVVGGYLVRRLFLYAHCVLLARRYKRRKTGGYVLQKQAAGEVRVIFGENIQLARSPHIRKLFVELLQKERNIILDFQETIYVDGAFMALLFFLMKHADAKEIRVTAINKSKSLRKLFILNNFTLVDGE